MMTPRRKAKQMFTVGYHYDLRLPLLAHTEDGTHLWMATDRKGRIRAGCDHGPVKVVRTGSFVVAR